MRILLNQNLCQLLYFALAKTMKFRAEQQFVCDCCSLQIFCGTISARQTHKLCSLSTSANIFLVMSTVVVCLSLSNSFFSRITQELVQIPLRIYSSLV